jgi:hypothetical protein
VVGRASSSASAQSASPWPPGNLVGRFFRNQIADLIKESPLIGGWIAMWGPMGIFLYDWWPIRAEAALADRLSPMPVRISYKEDGGADAWRLDWPAASPAARGIRGELVERATGTYLSQ